jgi:hypothetical protein
LFEWTRKRRIGGWRKYSLSREGERARVREVRRQQSV